MPWKFNGSSGSLVLATPPVAALPLTLAAWIRPFNSTSSDAVSIGYYVSAGDFRRISVNIVGGTSARAIDQVNAVNGIATSTRAPAIGSWSCIVAVFTSNSSRTVYCNGGGTATDTTAITNLGTWNSFFVGRGVRGDFPSYLNGEVDRICIWSAALTASEAASLAQGRSPETVRRESVVGYWPLSLVQPQKSSVGDSYLTQTGSPVLVGGPSFLRSAEKNLGLHIFSEIAVSGGGGGGGGGGSPGSVLGSGGFGGGFSSGGLF